MIKLALNYFKLSEAFGGERGLKVFTDKISTIAKNVIDKEILKI